MHWLCAFQLNAGLGYKTYSTPCKVFLYLINGPANVRAITATRAGHLAMAAAVRDEQGLE